MDAAVIVIGAGPTGLMLAGELCLAGVDVIVVDRLRQPMGQSRALGFTARAMEVLDQRGLLPKFSSVETSPMGHFGGLPLDYGVIEGGHFGARGVLQSETESVLDEWASGLGADVQRGWELVALTNADDHVKAELSDGAGGTRRLRSSWLVGCDGGHSTVRTLAQFDFPGTDATREMFLADVAGCDLPPRFTGTKVTGGMAMNAPLGGGVDRIIACELGAQPRDRTEPPSFVEVADAWERLTGEDIRHGRPLWVSAFGDATRQVTEYRRGRVLLAGDSAHVHLPAGGQGLSVGVQDAANLGWKLAAAVRGWAPPGLLDSYHDERHPVGARVLMNTQAQGLLYLTGEEMQPLRDVLGELMQLDGVRRHLAGMVSGLDIRYDVGTGDHPLLGRRLPAADLVTAPGGTSTSTTQLLHDGRGVLVDLGDRPGLRSIAAGWGDRVDVTTGVFPEDEQRSSDLADVDGILVRPDGHVVWVSPGDSDPTAALQRWFGAPEGGR